MNVAFISQPWNDIPPADLSHSIAIWTCEVAERLAQRCNVTVYGKRTGETCGCSQKNVQYRHIPVKLESKLQPMVSRIARLQKTPPFNAWTFYFGYICRIALDLRRRNCGVVHVHNFSQFVPVVRRFNPRAKIVLHMHCEWLSQLNRNIIGRRLEKADLVLGCSEFITGKIRNAFPSLAHKCETLFNGVDVNRFENKSLPHDVLPGDAQPPTVLFIGRVSPEKGLHVLLEAFGRVAGALPQARLIIVGPEGGDPTAYIVGLSDDPVVKGLAPICVGRYRTRLESLLDDATRDKVAFAGSIPHHQIPALLRSASILVHPTFTEAFGMPVVEAMAAGVPVVASAVGGIKEIIQHGKTGFLVERNDPNALSDAMLKLLTDTALRASMGSESRKRAVEMFSWESIADKLFHYYQNI